MQRIARAVSRRLREAFVSEDEQRHSLVGAAHLWRMKRQFQIEFLRRVGLQPDHFLLDLGCGTLRGGIPLIDYLQKGRYYGLESRENVLLEGKKELLKYNLAGKEPILILSEDIASLKCNRSFDFIWAFSVLIHMEDKIFKDCLEFIQAHLKPAGFFYANVNIGERENESWQEFPLVWRSLNFYEETARQHGLQVDTMGALGALGHVSNNSAQDSQQMLRFRKIK